MRSASAAVATGPVTSAPQDLSRFLSAMPRCHESSTRRMLIPFKSQPAAPDESWAAPASSCPFDEVINLPGAPAFCQRPPSFYQLSHCLTGYATRRKCAPSITDNDLLEQKHDRN